MKYQRTVIAGLGYEVPPEVLSSDEIEARLGPVYDRIGLHAGRLELMTGIRERRYWPGDVSPSEVASRAGRRALDASGVDTSKIGCIVHASVCRDFLEPATASVVHHTLGLPATCQMFDLSNACLGVANAMMVVATMIEAGVIEAGLVVAGENGKPLVDSTIARLLADDTVTRKSIKGSFPSLTIGSGAAAVVLGRDDVVSGHRLLGASSRVATEHNHLCRGGTLSVTGAADTGVGAASQLDMRTDAEALLFAGLDLAKATWADLSAELDWTPATPDRSITHQVGKAHTHAMYEVLGLAPDRGHITYDRLGNVGSVSLPITLAMAVDAGVVEAGHTVALLGIGSGLSCAMLGVQW